MRADVAGGGRESGRPRPGASFERACDRNLKGDDVNLSRKVLGCLAAGSMAAGALWLSLPGPAAAQQIHPHFGAQALDEPHLSVDALGGIAVMTGELGNIYDIGPSFGAGFSYALGRVVAIRVRGDFTLAPGATSGGFTYPDSRFLHASAGVEFRFRQENPERRPLTLVVGLGGGIVSWDADAGTAVGDFSNVYPAFHGSAEIGYQVHERLNIFVGARSYAIVPNWNDTRAFADQSAAVEPFGVGFSFPVVAGFRYSFL